MPVLDGFSAAREIRKFMPDVPILVLSMHRGKRAIQEAKLLGAQGFVSKSHLAETLLNAVDVIVRKQTFFDGDCLTPLLSKGSCRWLRSANRVYFCHELPRRDAGTPDQTARLRNLSGEIRKSGTE
jgi:DNA-binding NarL/FixJ family response regulator